MPIFPDSPVSLIVRGASPRPTSISCTNLYSVPKPLRVYAIALLSTLHVLLPTSAYAQNKSNGPRGELKSKQVVVEGVKGLFFPLGLARLMLKDLKAGKASLSLQPKLEQRIKLSDRRVKLLELDVATTDKIAGQWRQAAEAQAKQLAKADSVWRSPVLWFAVGLVIGVSGVAAAVVAK